METKKIQLFSQNIIKYLFLCLGSIILYLSGSGCADKKSQKMSDRDIALRIHKVLLNSKKVMYPSIDTVFSGD